MCSFGNQSYGDGGKRYICLRYMVYILIIMLYISTFYSIYPAIRLIFRQAARPEKAYSYYLISIPVSMRIRRGGPLKEGTLYIIHNFPRGIESFFSILYSNLLFLFGGNGTISAFD